MDVEIEKRAANILLDRGVAVPIAAPLFLRLLGKKTLKLKVKALTLGTLLKVSRRYLDLEIKEPQALSIRQGFELLNTHAVGMSEVIAIAVLNSRYKYWLCQPLAKLLRNRLSMTEMAYLFQLIIMYGGVEDFINTIRLTEATRITMPMNLSQVTAETS